MQVRSFARLVARVEDAGPGVMKVLSPLGLRPSQYVKLRAEWDARLATDAALRADFQRELAAARLEDPRTPIDWGAAPEASGPRDVEVPTYLLDSARSQRG